VWIAGLGYESHHIGVSQLILLCKDVPRFCTALRNQSVRSSDQYRGLALAITEIGFVHCLLHRIRRVSSSHDLPTIIAHV